MSAMEDGCFPISAAIIALGVFAFGSSFGGCVMEEHIKRQAVEAGVAEYAIVDPKYGRTEFRWKTQKEEDRNE